MKPWNKRNDFNIQFSRPNFSKPDRASNLDNEFWHDRYIKRYSEKTFMDNHISECSLYENNGIVSIVLNFTGVYRIGSILGCQSSYATLSATHRV